MKASRKSKVESRVPATARLSPALDPRPSTLDAKFSAVILAGGKSSRMGRDKAWLKIGGKTLLARQIELVRRVGATEVFISGRPGTDYSALGCRVLADVFPEAGPLAGIERGLAVMTTPLLLVLAVDMPGMSAAFLEKMYAARPGDCGVIPQINGRIEPLVAFYPKPAATAAARMLTQPNPGGKTPGPTDFARYCVEKNLACWFEVPATEESLFKNLNAPADVTAQGDSVL